MLTVLTGSALAGRPLDESVSLAARGTLACLPDTGMSTSWPVRDKLRAHGLSRGPAGWPRPAQAGLQWTRSMVHARGESWLQGRDLVASPSDWTQLHVSEMSI